MLKDALKQLMNDSNKTDCKIASIMASIDKETADLLVQALQSDISGVRLVKLLQSEGIKISRESLRLKRNDCFKSPNRPANCCMSQETSNETAK